MMLEIGTVSGVNEMEIHFDAVAHGDAVRVLHAKTINRPGTNRGVVVAVKTTLEPLATPPISSVSLA